jgi:uncharacterized protein (DUF3820 family)
MRFITIVSLLDSMKNSSGIIPSSEFKKYFEVLPVRGDGNCLFYSIEQLDKKYDYKELRKLVCKYYKKFDKGGNYPEGSIGYNLQMQMLADNEENDGTLHENNICENLEWAGVMDVIALTAILKKNIILMNMVNGGYAPQPFIYKDEAKTIFVKYNGRDHFEPILSNLKSIKATNVSPQHLGIDVSPETLRLIKESDIQGQEVSPETLRLIEELEIKNKSSQRKVTKKGGKRRKGRKITKRRH